MVADSVFAPADSPYGHTSDALWTLWCIHDRTYGSAVLSGTYADKDGYHNKRDNLPSSDYSSGRDVRNDDYGPGSLSAGLDVSMNPADMKTWTRRLKDAATSNDPRLKLNGEWILREFIGTLDGETVYCWVFTGGVPLGVGSDSGPDPGRSTTHLWHGHLSVIRKFANNMAALQQIGSINSGQSLAEWREGQMDQDDFNDLMLNFLIKAYETPDNGDSRWVKARNYLRAFPHTYMMSQNPPYNVLSLLGELKAAVPPSWAKEASVQVVLTNLNALAQALAQGESNPDTAAIIHAIEQSTATSLAAVSAAAVDTRDAVADLGEGGAQQVRAPQEPDSQDG